MIKIGPQNSDGYAYTGYDGQRGHYDTYGYLPYDQPNYGEASGTSESRVGDANSLPEDVELTPEEEELFLAEFKKMILKEQDAVNRKLVRISNRRDKDLDEMEKRMIDMKLTIKLYEKSRIKNMTKSLGQLSLQIDTTGYTEKPFIEPEMIDLKRVKLERDADVKIKRAQIAARVIQINSQKSIPDEKKMIWAQIKKEQNLSPVVKKESITDGYSDDIFEVRPEPSSFSQPLYTTSLHDDSQKDTDDKSWFNGSRNHHQHYPQTSQPSSSQSSSAVPNAKSDDHLIIPEDDEDVLLGFESLDVSEETFAMIREALKRNAVKIEPKDG